MLQTEVRGSDRVAFIESLTTADVEGLPPNTGTLSVFTNDKGGIRDDLIITKTDAEHLYLVTNAGCIDKDLPYLQENASNWRSKGKDVQIDVLEGRGLIALQGPHMTQLLAGETSVDLSKLYFMHSAVGSVFGVENCRVTRCGYTGEDGVEISVDPEKAPLLVERLLNASKVDVKLAGLGARDVLRLEAGLCLYGNDISEDITPIEAALAFVVAKRRRETRGFPGADKILDQLAKKNYAKRRVGLVTESGRRAPRSHLPIMDPMDKAAVGFVTSGCPSPCLGKNIAMGYVDTPDAKEGRTLEVDFGGRVEKVTVSKLPFLPTHYYNKPKESKPKA